MKNISLILLGCFFFASCGVSNCWSQTAQGPSMTATNQNIQVPNNGAISPALGVPANGRAPASPVTGGAMPNTRAVIPPAGAITPRGSQTIIPNTRMPAPNQPYTNNGISGDYGHLGPNGFYRPGTNGFYTPGTNGFYSPGTNGFYTPGTNGFYHGPGPGNYLGTPTNRFGTSVNR